MRPPKLLAKGDLEGWENTFEDTNPSPHSQLRGRGNAPVKPRKSQPSPWEDEVGRQMVRRRMVRGVPGDPLEWESSDALIPGQGETLMTPWGRGKPSLQHSTWRQQRIRRKKRVPQREGGRRNRGGIGESTSHSVDGLEDGFVQDRPHLPRGCLLCGACGTPQATPATLHVEGICVPPL